MISFSPLYWLRAQIGDYFPRLGPTTELFLSYPDFSCLRLDIYTPDSLRSVTRMMFADEPKSIGGIYYGKFLFYFGLPDRVDSKARATDEYGPIFLLLFDYRPEIKGERIDIVLSRASKDAHVKVTLKRNVVDILFEKELPIHKIDDDSKKPHRVP